MNGARAAAVAVGGALLLALVPTGSTAAATTTAPPTTAPPTTAPPTPAPATLVTAPPVGGAALGGGGVVTDLPAGVPAPPSMHATSYVVADLTTGDVIAARAAHVRHLPASTLKTLTVLTVLSRQPGLDQTTPVLAIPSDVVDGSKVGIAPGSHYTVEQLLQGMMLSSGNDAAQALARAAGGVGLTVARMQAEALALGARDTTVRNPSGLDAEGQLTSAYDLALFGRAGMALPAFRTLVATRYVDFPGKEVKGKKRKAYQIQNHNHLLANYEGAIGVKNGYTVAARWSEVGAATRAGHSYVVTSLGRTDGSWRSTAAMLDWAFAHGDQARPVGRLVDRGEVAATAAPPRTPTAGTGAASAQADAAKRSSAQTGSPVRSVVRTLALVAGAVAVVLLALAFLSARARRSQLRAARAAGRGRRPRR